MSKKNFKKSARESVASAFFSEQVENSKENTKDTSNIEPTKDRADADGTSNTLNTSLNTILPPYRINLKLKGEYKEYLDQVSWENRTSITQYLNDLIEKDLNAYTEEFGDYRKRDILG